MEFPVHRGVAALGAACPSGVVSPAHSAMDQQFLRGGSANGPSTDRAALRRGSPPDKAPRDPAHPAHQALERVSPTGGFYAVTCGHRLFVSPHNSR